MKGILQEDLSTYRKTYRLFSQDGVEDAPPGNLLWNVYLTCSMTYIYTGLYGMNVQSIS